MTSAAASLNAKTFDWPLANDAEARVREHIASFLGRNSFARALAERMRDETGTDFFEWVDHLVLSASEIEGFEQVGFMRSTEETPKGETVYEHPQATLPRVLV